MRGGRAEFYLLDKSRRLFVSRENPLRISTQGERNLAFRGTSSALSSFLQTFGVFVVSAEGAPYTRAENAVLMLHLTLRHRAPSKRGGLSRRRHKVSSVRVRTHTLTQQVNWDLQKTRESVQAFGPINQEHLREVSKKTKGGRGEENRKSFARRNKIQGLGQIRKI